MTDRDKEQVHFCGWCAHIDTDHRQEPCSACGKWNRWANYEPSAEKGHPQIDAIIADAQWDGADAIIAEAVRITSADRHDAYAPPEDNFRRIATVWNGLLDGKLARVLTPADVARMMAGMKLVRDAHKPKRDNRVDAIGYLRCLERTEPTDE